MLADHLVLFEDGRVIRSGSRDEVFAHPGSRRAAELLGFANLLCGQLIDRTGGRLTVLVDGVWLEAAVLPEHQHLRTGDLVDVAIRREEVLLHRTAPERPGGTNLVEMIIDQEIEYGAGSILRLTSSLAPFTIESDMPVRPYRVLRVSEHRDWLVEIPPESLHVMRPDVRDGTPEG